MLVTPTIQAAHSSRLQEHLLYSSHKKCTQEVCPRYLRKRHCPILVWCLAGSLEREGILTCSKSEWPVAGVRYAVPRCPGEVDVSMGIARRTWALQQTQKVRARKTHKLGKQSAAQIFACGSILWKLLPSTTGALGCIGFKRFRRRRVVEGDEGGGVCWGRCQLQWRL